VKREIVVDCLTYGGSFQLLVDYLWLLRQKYGGKRHRFLFGTILVIIEP
jgi:hypothetical protein